MLRTVVYLLVSIFVITLVRAFVGLISKAFGEALGSSGGGGTPPKQTNPAGGGELKQCASCGVYVSQESALTRTAEQGQLYFCSEACRDRR